MSINDFGLSKRYNGSIRRMATLRSFSNFVGLLNPNRFDFVIYREKNTFDIY